jgi:hypothetical protein
MREEAAAAYRVHQQLAACKAEATRASQHARAVQQQLEESERARKHFETMAEQRLGEVHWLRREMSTSWRGLVQREMALAVERTGVAAPLPPGLFPALAAEVERVAPAAMQRRAKRLAGHGRGLDAMHPDVDMYGSLDAVGGRVDDAPPAVSLGEALSRGPPDFRPTLARLAEVSNVL